MSRDANAKETEGLMQGKPSAKEREPENRESSEPQERTYSSRSKLNSVQRKAKITRKRTRSL